MRTRLPSGTAWPSLNASHVYRYVNCMPTTPPAPPSTVKSADRVLTLFELLSTWGREMSHADIAEALGIPKSSLTQLLKNMVGRGWLAYSPATKGYSLGIAFTRIARRAGQVADLATMASPVLEELTARTSESSALNVLKGDMAVVAATVLGPQRLVSHMRLGEVAPLYATSGAKVILACLPSDMQEEYLRRVRFEPQTPATIRSIRALRAQLRDIKRDGIAYSFDEWTPGITGMARPILSNQGEVLASINVAVPSVRFDDSVRVKVADALLRAVEAIQQHAATG
jgi:DNA-binding IclR family transcriptional regulator